MKINKEENDSVNPSELEKLSDLLDRYLSGQCTSEENEVIGKWYESLSGERETNISEEFESKSRIWSKISSITKPTDRRDVGNSNIWLRWAASIAIVCLSAVFAYRNFGENWKSGKLTELNTRQKNWSRKTNSTSVTQRIVLPDGSQVELKPQASISYPLTFAGDERVIHFSGDAFFDITKDEGKPFKVITGNITTRVLGTSFNIKANNQSSIVEVNVRTGKVSVYEHTGAINTKSDGVILTPNQKVTYYERENKWVTGLVQDPIPVDTDQKSVASLIFKDALIQDVLEDVASIYRIEIIVSNEGINNCTFTGDVSHMDLYDMLKVVCKSIQATYEVRGTRILINGDGCKIN